MNLFKWTRAGNLPKKLIGLVAASWCLQAAAVDALDQRFAEAELVAQVQISAIHRDVDNALSEPGMVAILGYIYSAASQQVWKGKADGVLAFRLGLDACERKLAVGGKYIIFARSDSLGRLQLYIGDAAVSETESAPILARLRQFSQRG